MTNADKAGPYWLGESKVPFAMMLRIIDTYCNPNAHDEAYDELIELAGRATPPEQISMFKDELRRVLSGDRDGLHQDALATAAVYPEKDDETFLRRLWGDLYPDEPVPLP